MLKIGIDARILQLERRGQGQYVYYLAESLFEIDKEDIFLLFYNGFKRGNFAFPVNKVNFKQVWSRAPGRIVQPLWEHCNFPPVESFVGKLDVFHNPFNFNFTYYTPIPSLARMVATFNGMADPQTLRAGLKSDELAKINRWFEVIARRASRIIVVSRMVKEDLLRRVKIDEKKIKVVYYGVNDEFSPVQDRKKLEGVLEKYNLNGKRYLFYAGAAEKNKNLFSLLEAFSLIRKNSRFESVWLVLAGGIDEAYRLVIERSKQLNLSDRVIFTGYIGHEDLPYVYNAAEAFVLPTFYEWFGIPVLEAMKCGVPVIASKNTGALEVAGDAAVTFDPLDTQELAYCMEKVLGDPGLRNKLKEKGLKIASGFPWEKTARETLEVYKEAYGA
ncbi:MAG: glycosyltransferase family 1 protein [Candidatus Omnitrophica bacterium]|nr:glycosyltransferase family 1 protein [Candidatus Omnitrophota bacterium]